MKRILLNTLFAAFFLFSTLINAAYINSRRGLLFKRQAIGNPCREDTECESKICRFGECSLSDRRPTRENCEVNEACDSKVCDGGFCSDTGSIEIGGSCTRDAECASSICSTDNTCKTSDNRPDEARCEVNEACESKNCDRFCFTPKASGQSCEEDSQCVSKICGDNKCKDSDDRPDGELCEVNEACQGKKCDGHFCSSPKAIGDLCTEDSDCDSSICSDNTCEDSDDRPAGVRCDKNEACGSKKCDGACIGSINDVCRIDPDCDSLVCRKSDNTCQSSDTREKGIECIVDEACKSSKCVGFSECE